MRLRRRAVALAEIDVRHLLGRLAVIEGEDGIQLLPFDTGTDVFGIWRIVMRIRRHESFVEIDGFARNGFRRRIDPLDQAEIAWEVREWVHGRRRRGRWCSRRLSPPRAGPAPSEADPGQRETGDGQAP